VEGFLAAVALALLDLDGLRGRLDLDPVEVEVEAADLLEALGRLDEVRLSLQLSVARDLLKTNRSNTDDPFNYLPAHLEMVLFLAHERVVRVRKVEALVRVHPVVRHGSAKSEEMENSRGEAAG